MNILKVKKCFEKVQSWLMGCWSGIRIFLKATFGDTGMGAVIVSVLCSAVLLGTGARDVWFPAVPRILCCVLTVLLVVLVLELLHLALKLLLGSSHRPVVSFLFLFCILYLYLLTIPTAIDSGAVLITALVQSIFFCLLGCSLWAVLVHRRCSLFICSTGFVALLEVCVLLYVLVTPGFKKTAFDSYPDLAREVPLPVQKQIDAEPGPYEVQMVTYGPSGADIFSKNYDLTPFAGQNDLAAWNRKHALGYTLEESPVQGIIWYPEGGQKCPVLFIVHGNHTYNDPSYKGYEYLGRYLASHGYVVVSVDENICNLMGDENDARGALLLENMWFLRSKLMTVKPDIWLSMDFNNVALAGHSRGGEAVTATWLFNKNRIDPSNGFTTFNTTFSIKSIIAIAPTVDQYEPAGHAVELQDVNYLLIHGSNDQDVTGVMGNKQYENISWPSADAEHIFLKSRLYIGGANHGQFNTEWGTYDLSFPEDILLNVKSLMDAEEQRTVLKLFMKTFLDVTLKGDDTHRDLLTDYRSYLECLPDTVYQQGYETSGRTLIADFEEDANLKTASIAGGTMNGTDLYSWFERKWWYGNSGEKENHLLVLGTDEEKTGTFTIAVLPADCSGRNLVFDLADNSDDSEKEPQLLDMGIKVRDASEKTALVQLRDLVPVYPTIWVQLAKTDYLWNKKSCRHQLQTVSIPFSAFTEKNPELDVTAIDRIFFILDPESVAQITVDNIGLE